MSIHADARPSSFECVACPLHAALPSQERACLWTPLPGMEATANPGSLFPLIIVRRERSRNN
jgi:hypothetical protein